jgi:hypothetical protein
MLSFDTLEDMVIAVLFAITVAWTAQLISWASALFV